MKKETKTINKWPDSEDIIRALTARSRIYKAIAPNTQYINYFREARPGINEDRLRATWNGRPNDDFEEMTLLMEKVAEQLTSNKSDK
jgi:hypothetical protein